MVMSKEAVDRIIYAVKHWADDIEDPVVRAMTVEMDVVVNAVMKAYAEQKGMKYPGGIPSGRAKFWIKFDNGDKYDITSNW